MASASSVKDRGKPGIVGSRAARPPRHAKRGDPAHASAVSRQRNFDIGRIGARIAGFDIVDAQLVEHAGNGQLVGKREIDAIRLRAVAQRRVEQIKPLAGHKRSPEIVIRRQRDRDQDGDQRDHPDDASASREISIAAPWNRVSILIKPIDGVEGDRDGERNHRVFEDEIIEQVPLERHVIRVS